MLKKFPASKLGFWEQIGVQSPGQLTLARHSECAWYLFLVMPPEADTFSRRRKTRAGQLKKQGRIDDSRHLGEREPQCAVGHSRRA